MGERQKAVFYYKDLGGTQTEWFGNNGVANGEGLRVLTRVPSGAPALIETAWKPQDKDVRAGLQKAVHLFDESEQAERKWLQVFLSEVHYA
jgi:hypothetical protein